MPNDMPTEPFEPLDTDAIDIEKIDLDAIMAFDLAMTIPSDEEMAAARQASYDWSAHNLAPVSDIATRGPASAPTRINLLSLPAWLEIARLARVPHIPAKLVAELPVDDFLRAFDAYDDPVFEAFHARVLASLGENEMIRMEQVAPKEIKANLSQGGEMGTGLVDLHDGGRYLDLIEDRFYTTFKDLGTDTVRAFTRPRITPMTMPATFQGAEGRWPVEFRVFVEDGAIVGIANYYRQMHLNEGVLPLVDAALGLAARMVSTLSTLRLGVGNHALCPDLHPTAAMVARPDWMPETWGSQSYTLDFLVAETGSVLFLEGGPAGLQAADPCAFLQEGREIEPDFLHGIALSTKSPILPIGPHIPRGYEEVFAC